MYTKIITRYELIPLEINAVRFTVINSAACTGREWLNFLSSISRVYTRRINNYYY